MKFLKILCIFSIFLFFTNCEKDEVVTGSPIGKLDIVPINVTVSTSAIAALQDEKFSFTATLPTGKTFTDDVTVEASAFNKRGARTKGTAVILAGQSSGTGDILGVGGDVYDTDFQLSLSSILLKTVEQGKHYVISSNVIDVPTGNTSIPVDETSKLQIKLAWPDSGNTKNKLRLSIVRPSPLIVALPTPTTTNSGALIVSHSITTSITSGANSANTSSNSGDYIVRVYADNLTAISVDLPYRLIVKFPNTDSKVFRGVLTGLTVGNGSPVALIKITKIVEGFDVSFVATQL